jgi:asparagine synthase (glutamine-hydrolysing)
MCGIAGIATVGGLRPNDAQLLDQMLGSLAHRGPDDQFAMSDDCAAIGARRLSIIDLDTGRQPISNEDGSIHATQNGEIYNYVELRESLIDRGHRLATKGDTETLVHLYEDYGIRMVEHLRGMFAFALWDSGRRRLVLARDRLGKKPLYWHLRDGRLTYGSELKALLQDEAVERRVDRDALAEYLQYQYVPAPRTILQGIQKLPPGSTLVWDGGEPRIERYWSPAYSPKVRQSLEADREECLELLRESVRLRLRSDVPVGVFLSGGMDSSTVVALMAEASQQVRTFSIGFEEAAYDELPYARQVARHFGTTHTEAVVKLDSLALLPELADHFDEPFGDSSAIPTFRVAQLAAQELKVVLTGDGGDEAFGGYERYRFQLGLDAMAKVPQTISRPIIAGAQLILNQTAARARLRRRAESWARLSRLTPDGRYVELMSIFDGATRRALLGDTPSDQRDGYLLKVLQAGPQVSLDRLLRADTLTYLPEDLLVKVDRATMANSLEARAPLLDHRVVEFAARLPVGRKANIRSTKILLRHVARQLMPPSFVDRPKMGFGVPVGTWFRSDLGDRFEALVLAADSVSRDHLDVDIARKLLHDHRAGTAEHAHRLWMMLMFELWGRRWLTRGARAA